MRRINILLSFFPLFFQALPSGATTVLSLSPEQLVDRAPIVLHGRVVQLQVDPRSGQRTAVFEALEVAKAPQEFRRQKDFYIPLLNRAIPGRNLIEWVPGAPELRLQEELVVFLRPIDPAKEGIHRRNDGQRIFSLDGFQQGKLRVFQDSQGIRRLATWTDLPEKALGASELTTQKTTPRMNSALVRKIGKEGDSFRTLDAVLNAARSAKGGGQ